MKPVIIILLMLICCTCHIRPVLAAQPSAAIVATASSIPERLIVDTDLGWDDILSISYLLKRPDIKLAGITVTGCGEANIRWGRVIALTLMELGARYDVPVSLGSEEPLMYKHVFPQPFRNIQNDILGLLGSLIPPEKMSIDKRPAWQFLSETLNTTDKPIRILSLGGFTNIARMLRDYPQTKIENIEKIYAMAGAVFVDGNIAPLNNAKKEWNQGEVYATNHWAEWNVFIDPLAAKIVFDSDIPLTLIPLDACNHVILLPDIVEKITPYDAVATLAKNILEHYSGSHSEGIPVPIFDPLATLIATGGLTSYQYTPIYLDVLTAENPKDNHCGKTIMVEKGSRKIDVVQGVSNLLFSQEFCTTLSKE